MVFYECPSILLDDSPYDPSSPLDPDATVKLSVKVKNRGDLDCLVTARFYCSSPATTWMPKVVGSITFTVKAGATIKPEKAVEFTPATHFAKFGLPTPDHFCFFVEATTSLDPASGTYQAKYDRHYGQQNVSSHQVAPGQQLVIPFDTSGLPGNDGHYLISLRQIEWQHGEGEPFSIPSDSLRITDPTTGDGHVGSIPLTLQWGEIKAFQAVIDVPDNAQPGSVARLLIEQSNPELEKPVGAVGVNVVVIGQE
ncbi:hypothetical protein [Streptomyces sp. 4N124]|uniref:hypothetical protein n=1 Tax=Streptomyces sp. 4N124 TaxID=3457420 RepID=UPI003FD53990